MDQQLKDCLIIWNLLFWNEELRKQVKYNWFYNTKYKDKFLLNTQYEAKRTKNMFFISCLLIFRILSLYLKKLMHWK